MDFLSQNDAVLHCRSGKLEIASRIVNCHHRCSDEGGQVTLTDAVVLPPGHVCFVNVDFDRWGRSSRLYDVVEPIAEVCNREGILMPLAVVRRACKCATLQLTNLSSNPRILPAGLILAYLEPADTVHSHPEVNSSVTVASVAADLNQVLPDYLQSLVDITEDLTETQKHDVSSLLLNYVHCFEGGTYGLGQTSLVTHKIDTGDHSPIKLPPRHLGWAQKRALNEEIDIMLAKNIIEPSDSPWSSQPVLVKKRDSTYRFCVDYRKLNGITRRDAYPLPHVDDCIDCLAGAQWFCTLDLSSGYWQIALDPIDRPKSDFSSPRGHYQFKIMPFGVTNGPATLEWLMELVLRGVSHDECLCYMDDVIFSGSSF